jgi:probable HAF family extracellular repeat protein
MGPIIRIGAPLCALVLAFAGVDHARGQPTFQVIPVPDGYFILLPGAISSDGSRVALRADRSTGGNRSIAWSRAGGFTDLGELDASHRSSVPAGISADGNIVVGEAFMPGTGRGYRWSASSGMMDLGAPPPFYSDVAPQDVSPNGDVVTGYLRDVTGFLMAFRWAPSSGFQLLGDLPGGPVSSRANAISGNGQVIVGGSQTASSSEAFRWTAANGMQSIGNAPGGGEAQALAVNQDGSVIVGLDVVNFRFEAFKWTSTGGMVLLGNKGSGSQAGDITPDGSKTVGFMGDRAVYWDGQNTRHDFQNELAAMGLAGELEGWNLHSISHVSDDGLVFVGQGFDPDGMLQMWIATIPEPLGSACLGAASVSVLGRRPRRARSVGPSVLPHRGARRD